MISIPLTFGALLLGAFIALPLSGFVTVQTFVYFRIYPTDQRRIKGLVSIVWLLDFIHTALVCSAIYHYLILHFGDAEAIHIIPETIALSVACTAVLTFFVHCFFTHRIFLFSKRNWFITVPIIVLAFLRLCCASVTTGALIHYKNFLEFQRHFRWVWTTGLALSSGVDVVITSALLYYLLTSRTESRRLNRVIDSLILYTFETGSLTCAATIVALIFWLVAPTNLIFMGMHFAIGKLYANSLLVTLNTRRQLRRGRSHRTEGETALPVTFLSGANNDSHHHKAPSGGLSHYRHHSETTQDPNVLQITVQKVVREEVDTDSYDKEYNEGKEPQFVGV